MWRGGAVASVSPGSAALAASVAMDVLLAVAPCLVGPLLLQPTARVGPAPVQKLRARTPPDPLKRHSIAIYAYEVGLRGNCA